MQNITKTPTTFHVMLFSCYTMYDRCDGQMLCDDGSDEDDCTVRDCSFPIQRKYCPMDRLCVSKEQDCPTYQDFSCPAHLPIRCKDYSGCYSSEQICDGVSDCSDITDEKFCESPTYKPPVTSDITRSLTTLLGILGCIPIFGLFVFLHKYCENKIMTYKPNYLQNRTNMQSAGRSRSLHSADFDPALHEAIAFRPLVRQPLAMYRPSSMHSEIASVPVHTPAPPYSTIVPNDTSCSLGPPPPYSSCTGRMVPVFTDMPPTYEEAISHTMVRAPRSRSDSEGGLLIRLQF